MGASSRNHELYIKKAIHGHFFPTGLLRIYLGMREDKGFLKISGSPSNDALSTIRHLKKQNQFFFQTLYMIYINSKYR